MLTYTDDFMCSLSCDICKASYAGKFRSYDEMMTKAQEIFQIKLFYNGTFLAICNACMQNEQHKQHELNNKV